MSVVLAMSRNEVVPSATMSLCANRFGTTSSAPRKASCSTDSPRAVGTGRRSLIQNAALSGRRMVNAGRSACKRALARSLVEYRHQPEIGVLRGPQVARFDIEPPAVQRQRARIDLRLDPGIGQQIVQRARDGGALDKAGVLVEQIERDRLAITVGAVHVQLGGPMRQAHPRTDEIAVDLFAHGLGDHGTNAATLRVT